MDMGTTLGWLTAAVTLGGLALWRIRRPYEIGNLPLLPWHGLLFVAILAALALLAHVLSLLTGQPLMPRGLPGA